MDDYAGPGVPTFGPRCPVTIMPNDLTYQCERAEGHDGEHRAWKFSWRDDPGDPDLKAGSGTDATTPQGEECFLTSY